MRLSDILNKPKTAEYKSVEPFIDINKYSESIDESEIENTAVLYLGDFVELNVGKIMINFFCEECGDKRTFSSAEMLHCLIINNELISIDASLECPGCKTKIQVWFLVEVDDIFSINPKVRILKRSDKLCEKVTMLTKGRYGDYTELLEKATRASREGFGAGSIVYLRKVFENIITRTAEAANPPIETKKPNGKSKPFKQILDPVKERCDIIPSEFSNNGYRLFGKLSDVVHGEYDEEVALEKFSAFYRLVTGVLDNVRNKSEFKEAISTIGLNNGGEDDE